MGMGMSMDMGMGICMGMGMAMRVDMGISMRMILLWLCCTRLSAKVSPVCCSCTRSTRP
jgi:hypothetical protein